MLLQSVPIEGILEASLDYTLQVGKAKAEEILKIYTELFPQFKETIMTAARQLRQEGRQEGRQESRLSIAKNMLAKGYAIKDIQEITGLSQEAIEKLKKED